MLSFLKSLENLHTKLCLPSSLVHTLSCRPRWALGWWEQRWRWTRDCSRLQGFSAVARRWEGAVRLTGSSDYFWQITLCCSEKECSRNKNDEWWHEYIKINIKKNWLKTPQSQITCSLKYLCLLLTWIQFSWAVFHKWLICTCFMDLT